MIITKAIAIPVLLLSIFLAGCVPRASSDVSQRPAVVDHPQQISKENGELEALPQNLVTLKSINSLCSDNTDPEAYRMGPEDSLAVVIFGEQELSGKYTIDNTGMISMPLIGEVLLAGCTLRQAENVIFQEYADGYLVSPSVSIEIYSFRPFYIIGEVRLPGKYDFAAGVNGLKASALAGGFTYRANRKTAKILRRNHSGQDVYHYQPMEGDINPGDVITIQERFF